MKSWLARWPREIQHGTAPRQISGPSLTNSHHDLIQYKGTADLGAGQGQGVSGRQRSPLSSAEVVSVGGGDRGGRDETRDTGALTGRAQSRARLRRCRGSGDPRRRLLWIRCWWCAFNGLSSVWSLFPKTMCIPWSSSPYSEVCGCTLPSHRAGSSDATP